MDSFTYKEVAATSLSFDRFVWKELSVRGALGSSSGGASCSKAGKGHSFSGGFHYRGSALLSSPCRNRFILWHYQDSCLQLLEVSLDTNLAHNALKLHFNNTGALLPDVCVQELAGSHVVFLFASETTVYRLVLHHPEAILKDTGLSAAGEGLQPSIFAFASNGSFRGSNTAAVFDKPSDVVPLTSCSGWISRSGVTNFALASPSGAICVVQLQPPDSHGLPIRSELKVTSMMNRLWSSLLPTAVRGGAGDPGDAPLSIATHMFSGEVVILSACRDLTLRLWSCQQGQLVMTHKLTDYLLTVGDAQEELIVEKLLVRKAAGGTPTSLRFGIYFEVNKTAQISLFNLLLMDDQLVLDLTCTYPCPEGCALVDFVPTNGEVWGVWRTGEGGEETMVQWATYESQPQGSWKKVILATPPSPEVAVPPYKDQREAYLDELFHPGRFASMAVCKALELYGAGVKDSGLETQQLREEAIRVVEQELQTSASSQELHLEEYRDLQIKCWAKFYGCCHEYQGLLSQPLGLFVDPSIGLACLLRKGMFSPFSPTSRVDSLKECLRERGVSKEGIPAHLFEDVVTFVECVRLTADQFPSEVLDSFLADLGNHGADPTLLAMELASVLLYEETKPDDVRSEVRERLEGIGDLSAVMEAVLSALDPSDAKEGEEEGRTDMEEDDYEEGPAGRELQLAVSQLFAGHVAMVTIGSALQEACLLRLQFCRDVLVLLCVMKSDGVLTGAEGDYPAVVSSLLLNYHSLHWLTTRHTLPTTVTAFESNVRQLASLEISAGRQPRSPAAGASSMLWELYLCTQGGRELRTALVRGRVLPTDVPIHRHWSNIVPKILTILLRQLWPSTHSMNVSEFLLSNCQHTYVQEYVSQVGSYVTLGQHSLQFLIGQSHLSLGELQKAQDCFIKAADGLGDPRETLLHQIVSGSEDSVGGGGAKEGEGRALVEYYIKVMRLFEQIPAPTFVVSTATVATKVTSKTDPNSAVLWSNMFKYHLELGHHSDAYTAIVGNPDLEKRKDCLRRFIIVLTEQHKLKELCSFPYAGLEEEVEQLIQTRARSVAVVKHRYYDLLYCLHSNRNNYRKAAYVMYEYGLRLGREAPGPKSLQKQANCYSTTLSCLHQVEPDYAWVVRPVELEHVQPQSKKSRRKRIHPSQKGSHLPRVEVLTIEDIEKEYFLVKAKLTLLQKDPSLTTQLSGPFVSADEVVSLCVQAGLFDKAIGTAVRCELSLEPIFQALTARCVHLSVNVVAFRRGVGDMSTLDWLGMNATTDSATSRENTIADKAWLMLRSYLEKYDSPSRGYKLQRCAASKLLSMGARLPQWMKDTYKLTNPAELLRLYLTFDLLEPAAILALEYIDAVMGHGKEFFGLETALHGTSPSVWLPYSALDHLLLALQGTPADSALTKLSEELASKLDVYIRLVGNTSVTMEEGAQQRHRQLLHSL